VAAAEHQHLVDAAVAALGVDLAGDLELVREHQLAAHRGAQRVALLDFLRIGQHQHRADDGLLAHRVLGDAVDRLLVEAQAFIDGGLDHHQRQPDQQHQAENDQAFLKQLFLHGDSSG